MALPLQIGMLALYTQVLFLKTSTFGVKLDAVIRAVRAKVVAERDMEVEPLEPGRHISFAQSHNQRIKTACHKAI